jgi:DNA-binding NtrC family response regulator
LREENQVLKQEPFVLETVKERTAVLGDEGRLQKRSSLKKEDVDLFVEFFCREKPVFLKDLMDQIERCVIYKILCMTRGNQKQAAMALGIKYTTLNEKLKKYGIRFQKMPVENVF